MFQKQPIMRRVLYSLVPLYLWSIYLYGWRVAAVSAAVFGSGILAELVMERSRGKKVSEAVLVTCALLSLSMPPAVPLWIAVIAAVFAVVMGKGVFGGFGRNIFNPAITGRLFAYISFPLLMQSTWMIPGAFGTIAVNSGVQGSSVWEAVLVLAVLAALFAVVTRGKPSGARTAIAVGAAVVLTVAGYLILNFTGLQVSEIDVLSAATPLQILKGPQAYSLSPGYEYLGENSLLRLFFGLRAGSIGESSIFLILAAAVYLIATKTANWKLMLSVFLSAAVLTAVLYLTGAMQRFSPLMVPGGSSAAENAAQLARFLFGGSFFFVTVFMATDPVSAPNKPGAQIAYGIIIGSVTVLIRVFSGFPEGTSFAVLVANVFASLLDEIFTGRTKKPAAKKPAETAKSGGPA